MPVEIRELVIRLTVHPPPADEAATPERRWEHERDALVADAVEQVLRTLEEQRER